MIMRILMKNLTTRLMIENMVRRVVIIGTDQDYFMVERKDLIIRKQKIINKKLKITDKIKCKELSIQIAMVTETGK